MNGWQTPSSPPEDASPIPPVPSLPLTAQQVVVALAVAEVARAEVLGNASLQMMAEQCYQPRCGAAVWLLGLLQ